MFQIYTAPISSRDHKTLQAKGQVWLDLHAELIRTEKTYLQEQLFNTLPLSFSREKHLRLTFTNKVANQLLEVAGVSS